MSLRFRSVVDRRDILRYAPWVRELKDRNGVYVIRDALDGDVYYVGESHSGRLYSTLTRHFQFWDGYTAGTTYDRDGVEVAVSHLDEPSREVFAPRSSSSSRSPRSTTPTISWAKTTSTTTSTRRSWRTTGRRWIGRELAAAKSLAKKKGQVRRHATTLPLAWRYPTRAKESTSMQRASRALRRQ